MFSALSIQALCFQHSSTVFSALCQRSTPVGRGYSLSLQWCVQAVGRLRRGDEARDVGQGRCGKGGAASARGGGKD